MAQRQGTRDRQSRFFQQALCDILVDRDCRAQDSASGKGHHGDLGKPLNGAIFSMQAMQDRKQNIDRRKLVGRAILGNDKKAATTARHQACF